MTGANSRTSAFAFRGFCRASLRFLPPFPLRRLLLPFFLDLAAVFVLFTTVGVCFAAEKAAAILLVSSSHPRCLVVLVLATEAVVLLLVPVNELVFELKYDLGAFWASTASAPRIPSTVSARNPIRESPPLMVLRSSAGQGDGFLRQMPASCEEVDMRKTIRRRGVGATSSR